MIRLFRTFTVHIMQAQNIDKGLKILIFSVFPPLIFSILVDFGRFSMVFNGFRLHFGYFPILEAIAGHFFEKLRSELKNLFL